MKKQTAVEYLLEEFSAIIGTVSFTVAQDLFIRDAVIKAKEMEQEQIIDAFDTGRRKGDWIFDGEKYYEETYKNS
jgi:hypothetical protein